MRRWLRAALASALAITLAIGALLGFAYALTRGLGRDFLRTAAEAEASRQLGVPVRIAALEGPLLPDFELVGVRIGSEGDPVAAAERVSLRIDLMTLFGDDPLAIDALSLDGLTVVLVEASDGNWELPLASAPDEPSSPDEPSPTFWIREAVLRYNRVELQRIDGQRVVIRGDVETHDFRLPMTDAAVREMRGSLIAAIDSEASDPMVVTKAELTANWISGAGRATGVVAARNSGTLAFEAAGDIGDWLDPSSPATAVLDLQIAELDLAGWSGNPKLAGSLTGTSHVELRRKAGAALEDSEATIDISVADSSKAVIESLQGVAHVSSDRWMLSGVEMRGAGVHLSAQGAGDRDSVEHLRIEARAEDLGTLAGLAVPEGTQGRVDLDLEVSGPFAQPLGRASLRAEGLVASGFALGNLQTEWVGSGDGRLRVETFEISGGAVPLRLREPAAVELRDGAVVLERWSLASDSQAIEIDGTIGDGYVRDLKLDLRAFDVASAARWTGSSTPLAGIADGQLRLDGAFPFPAVDGQLTWARPAVGPLAFEKLSADFETVEKRLQIRGRIHDEGREQVLVDGWLPYPLEPAAWLGSPQTSVKLRVDGFDLARLGEIEAVERLTGRIDLEVDLVGGENPSATGRVELFEASVRFPDLDRTFAPIAGTARFEPAPNGIRVDALELDVGGQRLSGRGVIGALGFHDVKLNANGLDIALAAPFLSAANAWRGAVDLNVDLAGPFTQPRLQAVAAWRDPEIAGQAFEGVDARVELDGRIARLELRAREGGREILRADALARYGDTPFGADSWLAAPETRLDVKATDLPLEWVQPFLSRRVRDVSGTVNASAEIRGGADPVVRGVLELANGQMTLPLVRQSFAPIRARISLAGESIAIEEFRVGTPGAEGTLDGTIQLANLAPERVDLQLTLDDLPIARSRALKTKASGGIRVTGPVAALHARGEIELRELAVTLGDEADTSLREIRILTRDGVATDGSGVVEKAPAPPGAYERAALDIRLRVPRNSWLRGSGAELDLTGELALRKQPQQPAAVVGSAQVVRGSYYFQQKRFEVRRGFATFDGGTAVDPLLDVVAAHRVRDVTILIFVTGRASDPKLRIGSESGLSESDALAYLLLGRPANQIGAGQQAGMNSAAAALASGVAAAQVGQMLAEALPIDSLDVTIDETGKPADIKIGKYITDRIFVRYGRTLGPEPEDQVRLELRINENWSVGSDVSTDDSAGADLIWSLDY